MLLCLNSEWQGCEAPQLEVGSRRLARALYGNLPVLDIAYAETDDLSSRDGVFALDCVVARFRTMLAGIRDAAPERVFTVGGSCASEAAPIAYLAARYDRLGVLWLDAHGDLNTPASSPSGHFHGMVLRTLLGDGPAQFTSHIPVTLDPSRVVIAGVRDLDAAERAFLDSSSVGLIEGWPGDVASRLMSWLRSAGVTHLYVHIDVDVFDPIAFGDALYLVPGGPAPGSVSRVLRKIAGAFNVVGVGVVESCGREPGADETLVKFLVDAELWPAV